MKPGNHNITIQRGEDFTLGFTASRGGVAIDLQGSSVYAQLREGKDKADTLIADFVGAVDINNRVTVKMDDLTTGAIVQNIGYYDVLVVTAAGEDLFFLRGRATIEGSVTVKP